MKKTIVAQIGVGYWGPNLLRNLVLNKDCVVKIVVELSKERQNFVIENYPNIKVSDDINKILNDPEIEAVVISTPVESHFDISCRMLNSGKNILVEKPMAKTFREVLEIKRIADKNNLTAMVGHTFLFNPAVRYIKKIINNGYLGQIRYIYSQRVNLGRIRNDVDALWNLAPHDISIIQYWLNEKEPIEIDRVGMSYIQEGIDDVAFLTLKYSEKILANIHVSWLDPHKLRRITIIGSKKMVFYDDIAKDKVIILNKGIDKVAVLGEEMDFDTSSNFNFQYRSQGVEKPKIDGEEPLKIEIEHFINCVRKIDKCLTDADHAGKVVKILERASLI